MRLSASLFQLPENKVGGSTPFTGAVYYGYGKLPYTAARSGSELKGASGKVRLFKTQEAAEVALQK